MPRRKRLKTPYKEEDIGAGERQAEDEEEGYEEGQEGGEEDDEDEEEKGEERSDYLIKSIENIYTSSKPDWGFAAR